MQVRWPSDVVPDWDARLARLREITALEAALHAEKAELLAVLATAGDLVGDRRTSASEVAAVTQVRRETALARMDTALRLTALPAATEALRSGRLGVPHALALVDAVEGYAPELVQRTVAAILDGLHPEAVVLPSVLKKRVASALATADPTVGEALVAEAEERVEVRRRYDRDGLATVTMRMTHLQAWEWTHAIDLVAQRLADQGDDRPLDQRRIAAILGLTRGLWPDGIFGGADVPVLDVDVLIPLGLASGPVTLDGLALTPEQARELLRDARQVRAATTDPHNGGVVATSRPVALTPTPAAPATPPFPAATSRTPTEPPPAPRRPPRRLAPEGTAGPPPPDDVLLRRLQALLRAPVQLARLSTDSYRPTAPGRRYIQTRDVTCTAPGCDRPSVSCDVDHRLPWPLGRTDPRNLASRCRWDHIVKQSGSTVEIADNGDAVWTTPDGKRRYRRPAGWDVRPGATTDQVQQALARLGSRAPGDADAAASAHPTATAKPTATTDPAAHPERSGGGAADTAAVDRLRALRPRAGAARPEAARPSGARLRPPRRAELLAPRPAPRRPPGWRPRGVPRDAPEVAAGVWSTTLPPRRPSF